MEKYLDAQAPQWVDFTKSCSPGRTSDFFEKEHTKHECIENCDSTSKSMEDIEPVSQMNNSCVNIDTQADLNITENTPVKVISPKYEVHVEYEHTEDYDSTSNNIENAQLEPQTDVSCVNLKAQADLDIIKSTPLKVISPKHNKETVTTEVTYNDILSAAMQKLELCKKPVKTRNTLDKTVQESNNFKTPNTTKLARIPRSIGFNSVSSKRIQPGQNLTPRYAKVNKNICTPNNGLVNAENKSVSYSPFKQDKDHIMDNAKILNNPTDALKNEEDKQFDREFNETCKKEDNKESQDEPEEMTDDKKEGRNQDDVDAAIKKHNQTYLNKKPAVLTWQGHKRSIYKVRSSISKPFVSMAEAVTRFQNETPERFRTRSNKNHMPHNFSKSLHNRMKPTIPISPALISKTRARPVTVLSQEERERLEMEEIKKHKIKANPIPLNVLRGPRIPAKLTGVAKKPTAVADASSTMKTDEKACAASSFQFKNVSPYRNKIPSGSKNTVSKVIVTNTDGIIVKQETVTFFGVPTNTGIVRNATRVMPFSFEARDKDLQIKKEQRLKNLQEANSKTKVEFHARPVPDFSKPPTPSAKQQQNNQQQQSAKTSTGRMQILPCPFSFEERDKKLSKRKEQLVRQVLEEDKRSRVFRANPVPVFKPVMVRGRSKEHIPMKDKSIKVESARAEKCEDQENREPNIKPSKIESVADKQKVPLKARPLELNTDKRARERREFDEKLKRKEMEEEMKRQQENQKQLERDRQMKMELRKRTEMKARPMPKYKPPITIKATKQLTVPQSPAFLKKSKKAISMTH